MIYILDTNIIRKLLFHFPKKGKLFEEVWASLEAGIEAEMYISVPIIIWPTNITLEP